MIARALGIALVLVCTGCTAGGVVATTGGGANVTSVTTIDVSIAAFALESTPLGDARGFSPEVTNVSVGSGVRFLNVDNTEHTATSIPGATAFPSVSPFGVSALQPTANVGISGSWGAGALEPGQMSQVFAVSQPGTYIYGCFFHYSGGMRGVIVAK
jgi:plastocyanin